MADMPEISDRRNKTMMDFASQVLGTSVPAEHVGVFFWGQAGFISKPPKELFWELISICRIAVSDILDLNA